MNPNDVKELLDMLVMNGQYLATEVYKMAYQQAIYYGISDLVWSLVFCVVLTISIKTFWKLTRIVNSYDYRGTLKSNDVLLNLFELDLEAIITVILVFTIVISTLAVPILFACGLNWLINPEFGAIRVLLGSFPQ